MEIPASWRFVELEDDALYIEEEKLTDPVDLSIYLNKFQYPINQGYLDKLDEELADIKLSYPDYKKEEITFNGYPAFKLSYTYYNHRQESIYIPYGYTLVGISTVINLDEEEKQTAAIKPILDSIKLHDAKTGRVPLMGVRKRYHNTPLGPGIAMALISAVQDSALRRGLLTAETSWILEDNAGMRSIMEMIGGTISKRYRMYEKALA